MHVQEKIRKYYAFWRQFNEKAKYYTGLPRMHVQQVKLHETSKFLGRSFVRACAMLLSALLGTLWVLHEARQL